jgi:hypothetical protein
MGWCLGGNIAKSQAQLIAVHLIAGDFTSENFSKNRVVRHGKQQGGNEE